MFKWIFAFVTFLSLFGIVPAHAYFRGNLEAKEINYSRSTSIVVVGHSKDQGDLFVRAALTRAHRIREVYPNRQVFVLVAEEDSSHFHAGESLERQRSAKRLGTYSRVRDKLSEKNLIKEISYFQPGMVESVDFFSHSTPHLGLVLQDNFNRADGDSSQYRKVSNRFSSRAFAMIHGCNAGFELAQNISSHWGIPVAGALTGSDFEFQLSDGLFYPDFSGFKPESLKKVSQNQLRMKPFPVPYTGRWVRKGESFERGLAFYKFSCAQGATDRCLRGMAESMLFWVAPTKIAAKPDLASYKAVVQDYLCPNHTREANLRQRCIENLEASLANEKLVFNGMYKSKPFECGLQGCNVKISCRHFLGFPLPGTCSADLTHKNGGDVPNTMNREYKLFMRAFDLRFGQANAIPQ